MAIEFVEDLFLADDLEAADMPGIAEWVRTSPHEHVERERDGLLRVLGRYAETSAGSDPARRQVLALSDRLHALGCNALADQVREAQEPGELAWWLIGCHDAIEKAAEDPEALRELLELTYVEFLLRCSRCDGEAPVGESGSWAYETSGKLVCPDCRQNSAS